MTAAEGMAYARQEASSLVQAAVGQDQEGQADATVRKQAGGQKKKRSPEEEAAKQDKRQRRAACKSSLTSGSVAEGNSSQPCCLDR